MRLQRQRPLSPEHPAFGSSVWPMASGGLSRGWRHGPIGRRNSLASSGVWLGSDGDVPCAKRLVGAVSVVVKPPPRHTAPAGCSVAGCVRPMRTGAEMRSIVRRNPYAPRRRKFYSERQTPPMRRRTPTRHAHHAPLGRGAACAYGDWLASDDDARPAGSGSRSRLSAVLLL